MNETYIANISDIQPSQLYISESKKEKISKWLTSAFVDYDPIPVIKLNNKLVSIDGHTRMYLLASMGVDQVKVIDSSDDKEDHMYSVFVEWCEREKIESVHDLMNRELPHELYQVAWIERCENMLKELEKTD
jgi:hypothetical protein